MPALAPSPRSRARRFALAALLALGFAFAADHVAVADVARTDVAADAGIAVTRVDGSRVTLDAAKLAALPRRDVEARHKEQTSRYTGSDLRAVLAAADALPGERLGGALLRRVVRIEAADGYVVVFSLAELDPDLGNTEVLLVDRENDAALPAATGPWRLVVPGDARPARWSRQVRALRVVDVP